MPHSPLLLQLVVILVTARVCGLLLRYLGQPPVIGEMAAGIVLGPIILGSAFPVFHASLFAAESLPAPGSVRPKAPTSLPSNRGTEYLRFCSSLP